MVAMVLGAGCTTTWGPACEEKSAPDGAGGGAAEMCGACAVDDDCFYAVPENTTCSLARCVGGQCQEERRSPLWTCGVVPGEINPAHCYGGSCCFTCIVDSGSNPGGVDPDDGPCVAGTTDTACGFGGGVCRDCKADGKVCVRGACVAL